MLFSSFYMLFLPAVAVLSLLVLIVCLIFGLL